jgi:hypothetical protein
VALAKFFDWRDALEIIKLPDVILPEVRSRVYDGPPLVGVRTESENASLAPGSASLNFYIG